MARLLDYHIQDLPLLRFHTEFVPLISRSCQSDLELTLSRLAYEMEWKLNEFVK
jgi:hypothetical protein